MTKTHVEAAAAGSVVVVGASLAGLRAVEGLRELGFAGRITVLGDEPDPPYDRPPLSKGVLAGSLEVEDTLLPQGSGLDVDWQLGHAVIGLDPERRVVRRADGREFGYDGLVIATGASPRMPRAWRHLAGVHGLRTLSDARRIRAALEARPRRVAVLGAGFVGSEVAATVRRLGIPVTLIDAAPSPMQASVGPVVARYLADLHRRHRVDLRTGAAVADLDVDRHRQLSGVRLHDGTLIPADLAVVGFGVVPNTEWLEGAGLMLDDGVVCDANSTVLTTENTPATGIVAAGDVARWPHPLAGADTVRIEHWSNAATQARLAVRNLHRQLTAGSEHPTSPMPVPSFWSDQYDDKLLAVGLPGCATSSAVVSGDPATGRFIVGYGGAGRLVGAVAVNHARGLVPFRRLLQTDSPWPLPDLPTERTGGRSLPLEAPSPATSDQ